MVLPVLRPMSPADVDPSAEMILGNEWGVRRDWLDFATTQPDCVPVVGEADGSIVATGVGTVSGPVGWIGTIFVEPAWRGQGLGRAITQTIIDRLEDAGCRTLVLVATAEGRRLYERMGFEVQTRYRILEAPGLMADDGRAAGDGRSAASPVRPYGAADLDSMLSLDRAGTGEDRSAVIRRLATPVTARVAIGDEDAIDGFVIRAPWGGGATVARSTDAAVAIATARRVTTGPTGRVRVGILAENEAGRERLHEVGFVDQWSAPRMIRGEQLAWRPEWIWGQFNHAMG
jgi:GNAT superfamily N-acetyltransferase